MSQFRIFCASAVKAKALDQAALLSNVALGSQGKEKSIKDAVNKILKDVNA